jgi:hypothetical protein
LEIATTYEAGAPFEPHPDLNNSVDWNLVVLVALPIIGVLLVWGLLQAFWSGREKGFLQKRMDHEQEDDDLYIAATLKVAGGPVKGSVILRSLSTREAVLLSEVPLPDRKGVELQIDAEPLAGFPALRIEGEVRRSRPADSQRRWYRSTIKLSSERAKWRGTVKPFLSAVHP